jgi:hypothetical protein
MVDKKYILIGALVVLALLFLVGLGLYYSVYNSNFVSQKFKSGFSDLGKLEPIVRFHIENRKVKEMYLTQLNVDVGEVERSYKRFIDNADGDTPRHIYDSAVEIYNYLGSGGDFRNRSDDTNQLTDYLINMDKTLTDYLNSKYFTADRLNGGGGKDRKTLDQYTAMSSDSNYSQYLSDVVGGNQTLKDIQEDMHAYLNTADFPISRYVESLEMTPDIVGDSKSYVQAATDAGIRVKFGGRPYVGSTNPLQIAEDDPLPRNKFDTYKDYNIPKPGVLSGQAHDIDAHSPFWQGRRAGQVYTGM